MCVLQALLLFLKLATGRSLFYTYKAAQVEGYPHLHLLGDEFYIETAMKHISWWIIPIPTYFIIAKGIILWASKKLKMLKGTK